MEVHKLTAVLLDTHYLCIRHRKLYAIFQQAFFMQRQDCGSSCGQRKCNEVCWLGFGKGEQLCEQLPLIYWNCKLFHSISDSWRGFSPHCIPLAYTEVTSCPRYNRSKGAENLWPHLHRGETCCIINFLLNLYEDSELPSLLRRHLKLGPSV